jgi:DNA-binding transcriptional MerR regulator
MVFPSAPGRIPTAADVRYDLTSVSGATRIGGVVRIGDLAARAKVSVRSLRYYEEQGLLTADRSGNGQRLYPEAAVERVQLVQQLYAAGLSSRTIAQLLPSVDAGRATPEDFALLASERARITAQVAELEAARQRLDEVIHISEHPTPEFCPALREPDAPIAQAG